MAPRSTEWAGLRSPVGFERCVRGTVREVYGYVALLVGRDRREAERLVTDVYRSLFVAARAGQIESVTLGSLRSASRRVWLDGHRDEILRTEEVRSEAVSSIDALSVLERAALVLLHVNGMSPARAASELGRTEREVTAVGAHAVRRLRGTADTRGAWLRAYFGPTVSPAPGLVDRIIRDLGAGTEPVEPERVEPEPVELEPVEPEPVEPESVAPEPVEVEPDDGFAATVELAAVELDSEWESVERESAPGPQLEPVEPDAVELEPVAVEPESVEPERVEPEPESEPEPSEDAGDDRVEPTLAELAGGVPAPTDDSEQQPVVDAAGEDVATVEQPVVDVAGEDVATVEQPVVDATTTPPERVVVRSSVDDSGGTRRPPAGDLTLLDTPHESFGGVPPAGTGGGPAGRGWLRVAVIAVAALVVGAAVVWAVTSGDADPTEATPTTPDASGVTTPDASDTPATSEPDEGSDDATDEAPTTEPAVPVTEAPAVPVVGTAVVGESSTRFDPACTGWVAGSTPLLVEVADTFGPLGRSPAATATLPSGVADDGSLRPAALRTDRIDAGVLLQLTSGPDDATERPDTMVVLVGLDGSVRWVRCFDTTAAVLVQPNDDVPLAVGLTVDDVRTWYRASLADGSIDLPVDPVTALALDIIGQREDEVITPGAVVWDDIGLFALDDEGDIAWTDDEVTRAEGSPLSVAVSGDIAVAAVCPGGDCSTPEVRGYDVDSGVVVWTLEGFDAVAAAGDGFALVRHPTDGWDLVETGFGDPVEGQHWDDVGAFDPANTSRFGSVLVTVLGDTWSLWLPEGSGVGPVTIDLSPAG